MTIQQIKDFYDNYDPQAIHTNEELKALMEYVEAAINGERVDGLMEALSSAKSAIGDELATAIAGVIPDH